MPYIPRNCHRRGKYRPTVYYRNLQIYKELYLVYLLCYCQPVAPWPKRLDACLPPLGSRVRVLVTPCGFRGKRNSVCVGFYRGFSRFPPLLILFHHLSTLVHFIRSYDGASGVVGRNPCHSLILNEEASSHFIPQSGPVLDINRGY